MVSRPLAKVLLSDHRSWLMPGLVLLIVISACRQNVVSAPSLAPGLDQVQIEHTGAVPALPPGWVELMQTASFRKLTQAPIPILLPQHLAEAMLPIRELQDPVLLQSYGAELEFTVEPDQIVQVLEQIGGSPRTRIVTRIYEDNQWHPLFLNRHLGSRPVNQFLAFLLASWELGHDPVKSGLPEMLKLTDGACKVHFARDDTNRVVALENYLSRYLDHVVEPFLSLACQENWWPGEGQARKLDIMLVAAFVELGALSALGSDGKPDALMFPGAEQVVSFLVARLPRNQRYAGRVAAIRKYLPYWAWGGFPVMGRWGPLQQGAFGPRVARLKRRLVLEGYLAREDAEGHWKTFDRAVRQAVVSFRQASGLKVSGRVDLAMLELLSHDADHYVQELWRSLNTTLVQGWEREENYLLVNVPEYMTYFYRDGKVSSLHRSIIGFPYQEPGGRTPELASRVTYIDLNPTWTPTAGVLDNELARKVRQQRDYYARHKFVRRNGKLVQLPGPENTLGQVVVGFDNDNNLSLHGTNESRRFEYADRALSHGCVRVEGIEELASHLLSFAGVTTDVPLARIFKNVVERRINLASTGLPIYLVYDRVRHVDGSTVAITRDPYRLGRRMMADVNLEAVYELVTLARKTRRLAYNPI
jgi:hypothetical protein